jgi:UDP-hydrolysing UDP-N-acetyl-D-glucosamine 2-epimerase
LCVEFERIKPDIVLILGDRYEICAAVQAALLLRIPVAHIAGGDLTEGAIDDAMRHAITKMSHLHFATNAEAARRIQQMGEDPARVFVSGSPALDHLVRGPQMSRQELEAALGHSLGTHNVMVTFHPVTLAADHGQSDLAAMLEALEDFGPDTRIWVTRSNADSGGLQINRHIEQWADGRNNVGIYTSLGIQCYMSLMNLSDLVIGNSSSALYEAPSFGVPAVNVGDRQRGRLAANSVFHAAGTAVAVRNAISRAREFDRGTAVNPYGDGHSSRRIVEALKACGPTEALLRKKFHEILDQTA